MTTQISNLKNQISKLRRGLPRTNAPATQTRSIWEKESYVRGQSLFELVIAIGISALVIVVLVSLTSNALQNAAFAKNETLSGRYAQEATEWLRGQRDSNVEDFIMNASASFNVARCFNSLNWSSISSCGEGTTITGTLFVRQIVFSSVSTDPTKTIIEADVTVSWTDSKGLHQVTSGTNFSDWRQR